jgi:hypothetical protein
LNPLLEIRPEGDRLDGMVAALRASGDFRVLRRLTRRSVVEQHDGLRRGVDSSSTSKPADRIRIGTRSSNWPWCRLSTVSMAALFLVTIGNDDEYRTEDDAQGQQERRCSDADAYAWPKHHAHERLRVIHEQDENEVADDDDATERSRQKRPGISAHFLSLYRCNDFLPDLKSGRNWRLVASRGYELSPFVSFGCEVPMVSMRLGWSFH